VGVTCDSSALSVVFTIFGLAGREAFSVPEAASLRSSPAFLSAVKFLRVIK
jgi:hypothetical protein